MFWIGSEVAVFPAAFAFLAGGGTDDGGDVLGAFNDAFFDTIELPVRSGDRILLYSDGLIGIDGFSQEGSDALAKACRAARAAPLEEMIQSIFADLTAKKASDDDIVLMGVEV